MARRLWPAMRGGTVSEEMVFRADPPPAIGEVVGAWTNLGPRGPAPVPLPLRLVPVGTGAMLGFCVGLVGAFVVGGVTGATGPDAADAFLLALALGTVLGAGVGVVPALRPPGTLTLYVGTRGCVQIEGHGPGAKSHLLLWEDVSGMRTHLSVMVASGIRTAMTELHVRDRAGKERLFHVYRPEGEGPAQDPQRDFGLAILAAYRAAQAA